MQLFNIQYSVIGTISQQIMVDSDDVTEEQLLKKLNNGDIIPSLSVNGRVKEVCKTPPSTTVNGKPSTNGALAIQLKNIGLTLYQDALSDTVFEKFESCK